MGWQTSDGGLRLGSPVIDWWRWIGRGGRRRAAAVAQRRRGCGSSNGGEGRGDAQQCAAPRASMWPRESASGSPDAEDRRRGELDGGGPAAAAGARAPTIVWLGLINKRIGELLLCTRESLGDWVGEDVDGKGVRTGRRQWRTAGLGGGCACARGATGVGFYRRWRSVRGCGVNHIAGACAVWAARRDDVRPSGSPIACDGWHAGEWELATWRRPSARERH
jgi:hypothetical protein